MQIGVARNPSLEHAFGRLLKHLAHNNRGCRVERRSTANDHVDVGDAFGDRAHCPQIMALQHVLDVDPSTIAAGAKSDPAKNRVHMMPLAGLR